jgi:hypothetical protein
MLAAHRAGVFELAHVWRNISYFKAGGNGLFHDSVVAARGSATCLFLESEFVWGGESGHRSAYTALLTLVAPLHAARTAQRAVLTLDAFVVEFIGRFKKSVSSAHFAVL